MTVTLNRPCQLSGSRPRFPAVQNLGCKSGLTPQAVGAPGHLFKGFMGCGLVAALHQSPTTAINGPVSVLSKAPIRCLKQATATFEIPALEAELPSWGRGGSPPTVWSTDCVSLSLPRPQSLHLGPLSPGLPFYGKFTID